MAGNFNEILVVHLVALRRYALSLTRDPVEADDLVQDCCKHALSHHHVWAEVRDHRAYLFSILHNAYVDWIMRKRRAGTIVSMEMESFRFGTFSDAFQRMEMRDLKRGLAAIPCGYREVIILVGIDGLSYQQAADALNVPVGTVMSRLSRGRELLRRHMEGTSRAA